MIRPEQIANAKFTPVSAGTYNAQEVDAFLGTVAQAYAEMLNQNNALVKKISILAEKVEEYRNNEEAIKNALLDAHKMAESVSKDAETRASARISDAEAKAKEISENAEKQANELADAARSQAGDIVNNARTAVASLTERAQHEADGKLAAAQAKADEIISAANRQGEEIVGDSKSKYEYYTAELSKVKAEMDRFKAMVEALCSAQDIDIQTVMPAVNAAAQAVENAVVEAAPAFEAPAEEPAPAEEIIEESATEIIDETPAFAEPEAPAEEAAPVFEAPAENPAPAPEDIFAPVEDEDDGLMIPVKAKEEPAAPQDTASDDELDDIFALFDEQPAPEVDFASSIDDILPDAPTAVEAPAAPVFDEPAVPAFDAPAAPAYEAPVNAEPEFNLDGFDAPAAPADDDADFLASLNESIGAIDGEGGSDDDDDITSLFDNLFD